MTHECTTHERLEEAVDNAHSRYIGAHGAYWNAMRFSAGPSIRSVGSWPIPHCPTYTDPEKEGRRLAMEYAKNEWERAKAALAEFDASKSSPNAALTGAEGVRVEGTVMQED